MVKFVEELKKEKIFIEWLNIGGGIGIIYKEEAPPTPNQLAKTILPLIEKTGCKLIIEPGRFIVGNAGILVTKVLYVKKREDKNFIIVDAGMDSLIRVALYEAYHEILPEEQKEGTIVADVVGPICESTDFFAKDRELPLFKQGDYLVIMSTGAYSFSMASNYNSRLRPAEILVDKTRCYLIRRRESHLDLIQGESIPPRLVLL
jgi:diaminopimelate decarboxylase